MTMATKCGAAALVLVAAMAVAPATAQTQPDPLKVYSDVFSQTGTSAPPARVQRGTTIVVDVPAIERLEADVAELERRMAAHVADAGAHYPHTGYHDHSHGGSTSVYTADASGGHGEMQELLAELLDALVPAVQAQQPQPPLQVYRDDMSGPNEPAPNLPTNDLDATLATGVPLIARLEGLISAFDQALTAHVAARPGHAHGDPHTH